MGGERDQRVSDRYWLTPKGWRASIAEPPVTLVIFPSGIVHDSRCYRVTAGGNWWPWTHGGSLPEDRGCRDCLPDGLPKDAPRGR